MTRARRSIVRGVLALGILTAGVSLVAQRPQAFPHERHAGLFPLCEGCHQGVPQGERARFYPEPAQCAGCHDGIEEDRVQWQPPADEPDNVVFEHPGHPDVSEPGGAIDCTTCHTLEGAPRMAVEEEPVVPRCLSCHEHRAESHFIDADCATCHVPLAQAPFDRAALLALPEPADHETGGFMPAGHGGLAAADITRCAVCHTRERCESCHVDAAVVPEIAALPAAEGSVARALPPFEAHYDAPPSHGEPGFIENHGPQASGASCSACHTRDSCLTCHVPPQPDAVRGLPPRRDVRAPGVQVARRKPLSHQAPMFALEHGNPAATNGDSCTACHRRTMCVECHDAAAANAAALVEQGLASDVRAALPGAFHPANFLARHSAEAYGRRLECSNCHDSRLFCARCHESAGMSSARVPGRLGPGFHDAEPLWLLRHGQPARQGLESCASCHKQSECMQCHSVLGAFKVSPHGPDFAARRAQKRNAAICLACHITDPLNGGVP